MLNMQNVNVSTDAALSNYTRWANSGFWASFFQLDLKVHSFKSIKLPSANVRERMCNAMMADISTISSSQMNNRLSFMEAVLDAMRKRESLLLNHYFTMRKHGVSVLFLCSLSMAFLMFAIGMQNSPLSLVISSMIAISAILGYGTARNAFKKKYNKIQSIANDPGDQNNYILWEEK